MYTSVKHDLKKTLDDIQTAGLYKRERLLDSPQSSHVLSSEQDLINFCSNNYMGLANNSAVITAAKESLDINGFGMASVRFICGTQSQHDELEARLSLLLGTDATILFPSCFDANGGLFEVLLDQGDAVISDELNHASIIDGIRLCKATRYRYKNRDMADLEAQLVAARGARRTLIVTDGVFSMDGSFAPLKEICDLADKYEAMVMVDDSHAVGFIGATGAGTPEMFGVRDRVDIISGTLGKALGGASGGYISAHQEIVDLLRQRARPYLFSNSIPPTVVAGSLVALDLVAQGSNTRETLRENAKYFRDQMSAAGFTLLPGEHPIVPVMFADEHEAVRMAAELFKLGIYVVAFSYPVVPMGKARIRVQVCATHTKADIDTCVAAFVTARELGNN
ncbi:2-amino-3-ketobutyrate coenzyme A ligase [Actinomycetes bacterium]|nr:2-amino-3-ketobutyrate coenzyme A ligase [Actinomycetes bacterium]